MAAATSAVGRLDGLTDLAVLKIDPGNLPVIPTNKNRVAHVGDVVLAIGNPYNLGQTVTQGILSATGRISMSTTGRQTFLQTDASINRGNSGGALVNSLGELIGINTLTYDKITGTAKRRVASASPFLIELATKIMDKLIWRDGRVIRGVSAFRAKEIIPLRSSNSGIDRFQGIIVTEITPNGPASNAGFQINISSSTWITNRRCLCWRPWIRWRRSDRTETPVIVLQTASALR